jgi:hypothetical protein
MLDIEGGSKINPKEVRDLGNWFGDHLYKTAEIISKLQKVGWENGGGLYDLNYSKEGIKTAKEAKKELRSLGISFDSVNIDEFEDEE